MKKFIEFGRAKKSPSARTSIWPVTTMYGIKLGEVRWFGRWRAYTFYPEVTTVFEQHCLRKIAKFCETQTDKMRQQWKKRRQSTGVTPP